MESTEHTLSHAEQKARGISVPRAKCPVCTAGYRLRIDDTVSRHGPRGGPHCDGSNKPPRGLSPTGA